MASGLIRKRYTLNSLKQNTYFLQGFIHPELRGSPHTPPTVDITNNEFRGFSVREYIAQNACRIHYTSFWNVQTPFRGAESARYSSVVPNLDERQPQQPQKQVKEASPADCDDAVEDLSVVKAKAKSKQVQESGKDVKFIVNKVKGMLLWIGQAIKAIASMSRKDWVVKLHHWKDELKTTLQHYWLGMRLLWADVRISSRLLLKLSSGRSLTRRERQQLTRTTADIFRLVPFAVFIIVPFMEFLLPVFLKLFPNMLPSTFQDKMKEQEALKKRLNARMEYAKFLQETVQEMAKEVQNSRSGDIKRTAKDLDEFMNKVRRGSRVSNDEILGFAKLFNDELTLDNISRSRLVNMCKYMGISPFGTDTYLRYMLRKRLQEIKDDDKMIQAEGVESLSEEELRQACRDRGLLGLRSVDEMRQQIRDWLDLSLNHSVPSSLLILSRAFSVSGKIKPEEAVQATLSSLPDEVVDTVGVTALPSEDPVAEKRRKLEFLEMQEELIKEEEKEEAEQVRMKDSVEKQKDVALEEMVTPTTEEAKEHSRKSNKQEQLSELSRALAVLASASSVSREREEFLRLVNKEIELYNSMVEKEGTDGEEESKKAYRAARTNTDHAAEMAIGHKLSSSLIEKVDAMIQKLEKEIDDVDAKIGDRWRLLDRDYDGKVTPEEVASAAMYLKDTLGKEGLQELINNLSKDRDGKINVEDIIKLGSQKDESEEGRI
ncbi:putative EF-hand domain, letm1 ribosome-binding domain-containing protein [Helianthus annuus]|uniref:Mitochondrial proton/calcium exchanger protein n=1 Tax=Helianthus annuus TaxID=4232 RepID=A0A251UE64_HELAN|nr:mitochondrial proton/calcium exchanger protein [Helianthus annuus]KAF5799192.1 putative EF-hand domain, letm1 ribosome-binding domain-containing protein [Helianthus annuus]KAJ0550660.1 putative EF-hand domain, letm1 ribosome-binding domain-containing protein [Helianthus annuus]KAJ0557457.1 putative EF-hand domain, letm1 ribosome-binding domain-containing protein [Helianthus annuus]KAJ0563625.1 putative EF-hand domain, letm1 ribosome-binding domain-containing protein [Helianthus annuus]KAJ07